MVEKHTGTDAVRTVKLAELLTREWFSVLDLRGRNLEVAARLIFRIYVAAQQGNLLCKTHVTRQAGIIDNRTADKYVKFLIESRLIRTERSRRDRREILLVPTKALTALVETELAEAVSFLHSG